MIIDLTAKETPAGLHFGEDGPESFSEGTVVYINQDHPLYWREAKKAETHIMNLARLLTQEITMMKDPRGTRARHLRGNPSCSGMPSLRAEGAEGWASAGG